MDVDLRIVHGAPDDEELAALMAVLTVLAHRRGAAPAPPVFQAKQQHDETAT
ncbi:acyl-CoA carboxylase subunit epsilon, partial [Streptomyces sp. NPDC059881]|uniref:acyl-CoA carboxylase subunit epsilon n=1 Tax=Streptomyces sp. NPDC059881 TaxID=3346986 RepID=UPI00366129FE